MFAKPPVAGQVKTRLAPILGEAGAATLARAFLTDTWGDLSTIPWAKPVLASTIDDRAGLGVGQDAEVWLQGEGDLGARLERILCRALAQGPWAIALGADSPGLPPERLDAARRALEHADAVLGPTPDGGYYLLGLRRCEPGLLAELPWSAPDTFTATRARLRARGYEVAVLPGFFDIDVPDDLRRLRRLLGATPHAAPHTREALARLLPPQPTRLSVIVPTLDEGERIRDQLTTLIAMEGVDEIIVVDGGSTDGTIELVAEFPEVRLAMSPTGRATQLNTGASLARGEVLLFLHADVRLPPDAAHHIDIAMRSPDAVGGHFKTWTVPDGRPSWLAPLLHLADIRSRIGRYPYGDQAIFVRRAVFERLGGFPDIALMEDYAFSRKLHRAGRIALCDARVTVSGRRFLQRPLYYSVLVNAFPPLFRLGVPPRVLARWYRKVR